jgi:hypothetical protein
MSNPDLATTKPTVAGRVMTPEEKRQRRARSIALALALGALVALFYVVTIAKLGANALASHI